MIIDPHLPAEEQEQQRRPQRQHQSSGLEDVIDIGAAGVDVVTAVGRVASCAGQDTTTTVAGLGDVAPITSGIAEASSGVADAAEAGDGILSALGDLFGDFSF